MALRNGVSFGIVFLVTGLSLSDINLDDKPNVECGPQQTEEAASNNYDPLPSEVERSSTRVVEYLLEVIEPVVDFQHKINI